MEFFLCWKLHLRRTTKWRNRRSPRSAHRRALRSATCRRPPWCRHHGCWQQVRGWWLTNEDAKSVSLDRDSKWKNWKSKSIKLRFNMFQPLHRISTSFGPRRPSNHHGVKLSSGMKCRYEPTSSRAPGSDPEKNYRIRITKKTRWTRKFNTNYILIYIYCQYYKGYSGWVGILFHEASKTFCFGRQGTEEILLTIGIISFEEASTPQTFACAVYSIKGYNHPHAWS